MAIGWFIATYKRRDIAGIPRRYCAMDDATNLIYEFGGRWTETEIMGNRAIVKVKASVALLQSIAGLPGIKRLPKNRLDDSLADLPATVKKALRDELIDQGYTLAEIKARFGNDLGSYTLRDVLKWMARHRRKPRYDSATDTIIMDGELQTCRAIESVDSEVFD